MKGFTSKRFLMIVCGTIIIALMGIILILLNRNSESSVKIYSINGESENFYYANAMFVLPNHLLGQWANEILKLYPTANILVATQKDFEKLIIF